MWLKVKDLVKTLESWVKEIVEVEGNLQYEHIGKRIESDRDIADKIVKKSVAWREVRECNNEEEKRILMRVYKNCKNILNKSRKNLREEHKKKVIKEIESFRKNFPGSICVC